MAGRRKEPIEQTKGMVLWASCLGKPQAADDVAIDWGLARTAFFSGGQGTVSDLLKAGLISVADLRGKNYFIAKIEPYLALMPDRYVGDTQEILKDATTWAGILETPASRRTFFSLDKLKILFKDNYDTARQYAATTPIPIACGVLAGYSLISSKGVSIDKIKEMGRSMFVLSGQQAPGLNFDGYADKVWQDFKESDFKPLRNKILNTHYGKKTQSRVGLLAKLLALLGKLV